MFTLQGRFQSECLSVYSRTPEFKRRSNFADNVAPVISHGETRVGRSGSARVLIQYTELPEGLDGDNGARAPVLAVLDLEGQPQPARPLGTRQHARRVDALRADLRHGPTARGAHDLRVESLDRAADHLRVPGHRRDETRARAPRRLVEFVGRRDESRVHERHRAHGHAEDGDAAAVRPRGDLSDSDAGELRDGAQYGLLHGAVGVVVIFRRRADVQGEREHPCVLAGTVVSQNARSLATLAQPLSRRAVERLVYSALQKALVKADLPEHRGDGLGVDVLAAVRAAGDGPLSLVATEAVCRAARDERDGLGRVCGRAKVRERFRLAETGRDVAVAVNRGDVPAVA